jgi:tRNA1(Val) A37 N6-methylase TrmN6
MRGSSASCYRIEETILTRRRGCDGDVTVDAFLGGALKICQPRHGYRAGIDAVLLAAAVPGTVKMGGRVLDVGAGTGVVGLCVARRLATARVTLIEREPDHVLLARENVVRNGLENRVEVIASDVIDNIKSKPKLAQIAGSFEHVVANPPYNIIGRGTVSSDSVKAGANAMPATDLQRWAHFLAAMTKPGGTVTVIQRADALGRLLAALMPRFGGLVIVPLFPRSGMNASRVLVQGQKDSRAPLELRTGIVLHSQGNAFTPEIDAILRQGLALDMTRSSPKRRPTAAFAW